MKSISPWIQTTDKCNLACEYCHVKGDRTMSEKVYSGIKEFLIKSDYDLWNLRMAGGEPLIVFDKWKVFAVDMLKYKQTHIEILTNFKHIPGDLWEFIGSDNIHISISIDGGSKNKILDKVLTANIKKLPFKPVVMTVLSKDTLENFELLAGYIGKNAFKWHISTDYFFDGDIEPLIGKMITAINILKAFNYDFNLFCFNNIKFDGYSSGCCAGDSLITIDINGDIYGCQTEICKKAPVGNIFTGFNSMRYTKESIDCLDCSIKSICSGWCPLYHVAKSKICDLMKFVVYEIKKEV